MNDSEPHPSALAEPLIECEPAANAHSRPDLLLASAMLQQSDDAIILTSPEGIVRFWNPGAEHLYGYSCAEMVGASIAALVPPERGSESRRLLARALADEPVAQHDTVRVRKDGRRVDVSLTVSALRDRDGGVGDHPRHHRPRGGGEPPA